MSDGYLLPFLLGGVVGGGCEPEKLSSKYCFLCVFVCFCLWIHTKAPTFNAKIIQRWPPCCFQCSYCDRMYIFVFICNLYIEMWMEYLSHKLSSFKPHWVSVFWILMCLWEIHSLQFSLNKMNSFLTVHQANPWVFFVQSRPFLRVRVRSVPSLTYKSKPIYVSFCLAWTEPELCLLHVKHKRGICKQSNHRRMVREAWGRVILLLGCLPAC